GDRSPSSTGGFVTACSSLNCSREQIGCASAGETNRATYPVLEETVGGRKRRMAAQIDLFYRREPADPKIGIGNRLSNDERGIRDTRLPRHRRHPLIRRRF